MFAKRSARKKMFVSAAIQGRFITRMAAYWVLYHIALWHGMFVYRYLQYRSQVLSGEPPVPFSELYGQFVIDYYPMAVCAALILPVFMFDFVQFSHRIAGPLVRFRNTLHQLIDGQVVEKVQLRKGDLLTEFQDTFNDFLAFYNRTKPAAEVEHLTPEQAQLVESVVASHDVVAEPSLAAAAE